jgi:predicted nucleic acid-binding protein
MEASTVFIDTSIFISKNYHFEGSEFQSLIRLAKEDKINVVLTDITLQEIRSHIDEDTETAIQEIQKTRKKAKILRNFNEMPLGAIFEDIDLSQYKDTLRQKLESFIKNCGIKIINNNTADIDNVFKLYFQRKSPFGEGKKKCEFPDAFVLDALDRYAKNLDEKIYVISEDKDFAQGAAHFDNIIYSASLKEFLNIATIHYELLAPQVIDFLKREIKQVTQKIEKDFLYLGFYLSDQEGDVDDVNVTEVSDPETFLIDVNDGYAIFEITCNISYSANVIYDDLETASYDSEDKVLIPWRKIDAIVEREERVEAEVTITFSHQEPHNFEVEDVSILSPKNDVSVYANEDDWY